MPRGYEGPIRVSAATLVGMTLAIGGAALCPEPARAEGPTSEPKVKKSTIKIRIKAEFEIETETTQGSAPSASPAATPAPGAAQKDQVGKAEEPQSRGLRLGILDRPGELAAREVFYEPVGDLAVMQRDIVIGKTSELSKQLRSELGSAARGVNLGVGLTDAEKRAIDAVKSITDAERAAPRVVTRVEDDPEVQELARSVVRIPQEVVDALGLEPDVKDAIAKLRALPAAQETAEQLATRPPGATTALVNRVKADNAFRDRLRSGLAALAARAAASKAKTVPAPPEGTRGLPGQDEVSRSVDLIQGAGKPPADTAELQRLAALAALAVKDPSLGLSPEQKSALETLAKKAPESVKTATGSPFLVPEATDVSVRSVYTPFRKFLWPKTGGRVIVPYVIDPSAQASEGKIKLAADDYNQRTVIKLQPRTNERDYIRFVTTGSNLSPVGRQGGEQTIQLQSNPPVGTVIHEIGHSLGLWHEQSRPDRDDFIKVLYQNIEPGLERQFDKTGSDGETFGDYDFSSVMHYGATAFSRPGSGQPTIVKKDGTPLPSSVGNLDDSKRLSDLDISTGLEILYGAKP